MNDGNRLFQNKYCIKCNWKKPDSRSICNEESVKRICLRCCALVCPLPISSLISTGECSTMSKFNVKGQKYEGCYKSLNQDNIFCVRIEDYIRTALTMGFLDQNVFENASWRYHAMRLGVCEMTLPFLNFNSMLELNGDYKKLDPSEKTALNYWYGMIFTKYIAEQALYVPWLGFVNSNRKIIKRKGGSKLEPDFIGLDNDSNWHVFEAKARQQSIEGTRTLNHALLQLEQVEFINENKKPVTKNVCAVILKQRIEMELYDPSDKIGSGDDNSGDESVNNLYFEDTIDEFEIKTEEDSFYDSHSKGGSGNDDSIVNFLEKYYSNIVEYIGKEGKKVASPLMGVDFIGKEIEFFRNKFTIALPKTIMKSRKNALEFSNNLINGEYKVDPENVKNVSLGLDGILIVSDSEFSIKREEIEQIVDSLVSRNESKKTDDENSINYYEEFINEEL